MAHGTLAAIDCGTNSTRLLIVDEVGATLAREMRITRLGEGVDATGRLASTAIERTLRVLEFFRSMMDAAVVTQARMVATSAVRSASNGDEFLTSASRIAGTDGELLSGDDEGRLSFVGATSNLDGDAEKAVILDIGGGSTEMVLLDDGRVNAFSMELGCVRLTERLLTSDPPTEGELSVAVDAIRAQLTLAWAALPKLGRLNGDGLLIGLAGTISTLAGLEQGLDVYNRDKIHHFVLTSDAVAHWCQTLADETSAQRRVRSALLEGRDDVIVGGALVLRETMARLQVTQCLASEADLLDGLILSMR